VGSAGSPSRGRVLALAILALFLAAFWIGPLSAYRDLISAGAAQVSRQSQLMQRYRSLIGERTVEAPPDTPDRSALMLPVMPEAQAIARLQQVVKQAAVASQVEIRRLQVLSGDTLPNVARVGVRIAASGDMAGLAHLLFAVEAARPLLYADNLQVHARAASSTTALAVLDFELDVSAFRPGAGR
jgi:general secretion pathway protein M